MKKQMKIKELIKRWADGEDLPEKIYFQGWGYDLTYGYNINNLTKRVNLNSLYTRGNDEVGVEYLDLTYWDNKDYCCTILDAILDDEEKRYLRELISPFRDKVIDIVLMSRNDEACYLKIYVKNYKDDINAIVLPDFKKGSMYKNMEMLKSYKREDLGL